MDPYLCCLIGVCCPPGSAEQRDRMAAILIERKVARNKADALRKVDHDLAIWAGVRQQLALP